MKDSVRASRKQVRQRRSQTPESFVYLVRKISEKKMTRGPTTKQASRRARNFILSLSLSLRRLVWLFLQMKLYIRNNARDPV